MSTNAEWLASVPEKAEEPELRICDPHHHLWMSRNHGVEPRYVLEDFLAEIERSGHNVVSSVYITCGTMYRADGPDHLRVVGETEFVNGMAAASASGTLGPRRIAEGIVGTAFLRTGDRAAETLDAHLAAAGARFKGIREGAFWDASPDVPNHRTAPPPGLYAREDFHAGFAHLAPRGLSFEALCYHPQLADVVTLARAFPGTCIILNHLGSPVGVGPYRDRDAVFRQWKSLMSEVARCENVLVKLGGIQMEVNGFGWHDRPFPPDSDTLLAATRAYYETAIELFGTGRCMFESNFPVDKSSCGYAVIWNMFKKLTRSCSPDERHALFFGNAARTYRLEGASANVS